MEKSSKLMESMLVAVNPVAIILGKLFAITLTGVIQIISWLGSLGLSFVIGNYGVKAINPDSTMEIIEMFKMLRELTEGMFSPMNCILAAVFIILGMLLYCSLAGIGGAMASKAEDLSSANMMFTLVLVVWFLATIYGGGMEGTANPVMDWIPFTAVMVTPANALL
jgi:ABC-2 type transport system permease protein